MGDDVRWVGNEKGEGRETEWSATAITPGIKAGAGESNSRLGIGAKSPDLGGRDILAKADRLYWWPSEVDVSIRPGWFYHDREQPKPLSHLAQIYLRSVGLNSALLLNIPPDRNGRLAEADVRRIGEFGRWIRKNFTDNLVTGNLGDNTASLVPQSRVNCVCCAKIYRADSASRSSASMPSPPAKVGDSPRHHHRQQAHTHLRPGNRRRPTAACGIGPRRDTPAAHRGLHDSHAR